MDQKFFVMLTRLTDVDVEARLRALFAELKGCTVLSVVQRHRYVTITIVAHNLTDFVPESHLCALVAALTATLPSLVRFDSVRTLGAAGTLDHVNRILKKP